MEDDKEVLTEHGHEHGDVEPVPAQPPKKTGPSRLYFAIEMFGMFIFMLLCAIALGSFGAKQAQLPGFYKEERSFGALKGGICLLFVDSKPNTDPTGPDVLIDFKSNAPCVFIFWGLTSGIILALALFIYSLVMLIIASKIWSWMRLVDCILCFSGFLGFFAFSVTLTAGLSKTCSGFNTNGNSCSASSLVNLSGHTLYFFSSVDAAKNCSWIITIGLFIFSVWNMVLVIIYFRQRSKKRRMARITESEFSGASSLSNPVEQPPYSEK